MKDDDYSDLLDLPHPTFPNHPSMPVRDRAAQFAPFAALTGFHDEIEKTRRAFEQAQEEAETLTESEEPCRAGCEAPANPEQYKE